jgi:hypothetical protein
MAAALAIILKTPDFMNTDFDNQNEVLVLSFFVFLAYLVVVVFVGLRHGVAVLEHKNDITELNTGVNIALANLSIGTSFVLIAYAVIISPANQILLYALSPIGLTTGLDIKSAIRNKHNYKKTWLYEHLGAFLGTGIAFHTAFAVFGASQIFNFNLSGFVQVIPWITPALIGVPAIMIWTRFYKNKYGDLTTNRSAHES